MRVPRLVGWGLALHGGGAGREEGSPAPGTTRAALSTGHRHAGRGLPGGGGGSAGGRGRRAGGPCRAGPGAGLWGRLGAAILSWRRAVPWGLWAERPTSALVSAEGWGTPGGIAGGSPQPCLRARNRYRGEKRCVGERSPQSGHRPATTAPVLVQTFAHPEGKSSPQAQANEILTREQTAVPEPGGASAWGCGCERWRTRDGNGSWMKLWFGQVCYRSPEPLWVAVYQAWEFVLP